MGALQNNAKLSQDGKHTLMTTVILRLYSYTFNIAMVCATLHLLVPSGLCQVTWGMDLTSSRSEVAVLACTADVTSRTVGSSL